MSHDPDLLECSKNTTMVVERFIGGEFVVHLLALLNERFWGCLKSHATTPLLKGVPLATPPPPPLLLSLRRLRLDGILLGGLGDIYIYIYIHMYVLHVYTIHIHIYIYIYTRRSRRPGQPVHPGRPRGPEPPPRRAARGRPV